MKNSKECYQCLTIKPRSEFNTNKSKKDGLQSYCRDCQKEMDALYRSMQSPTYKVWRHMKERCRDKKNDGYKYYGGRGITVCERWATSFENFLADMGEKPGPNFEIDRKDPDGNYELSNCEWVTMVENRQRQRREVWVNWIERCHKAEAELDAMIELEASVCPEDFGCHEYIPKLEARIKDLEHMNNRSGDILARTQKRVRELEEKYEGK